MLGDDYAGLEEFGSDAKKKGPKARMKKLTAADGVSPMDQLRSMLSVNFGRVIELFREWDEDGNQQISKKEFRQALPVLGVLVDRADADALFETFDVDGSGEIDYTELSKHLRAGAGVELDAALQDGAMGEIELERDQAFALRTEAKGANVNVTVDATADTPRGEIIKRLSDALGAPGVLARVIDIFRAWDDDDSGTVSKKEFAKALPVLGLKVSREQANDLFDTFDEDGSGSIDYAEIHKKLRKQMAKPTGGCAQQARERAGNKPLADSPLASPQASGHLNPGRRATLQPFAPPPLRDERVRVPLACGSTRLPRLSARGTRDGGQVEVRTQGLQPWTSAVL